MVMNENNIKMFLHCKLCLDELKEDEKIEIPSEYQKISVGWTRKGIQIWCNRHNCNILHINFEGVQHKADTTQKGKEKNES